MAAYYYYIISNPAQAQLDAAVDTTFRVSTDNETLLKATADNLPAFTGNTPLSHEAIKVELLKSKWNGAVDNAELLSEWQERARKIVSNHRKKLEHGGIPWQGDVIQTDVESRQKFLVYVLENIDGFWIMESNSVLPFSALDFKVAYKLGLLYIEFITIQIQGVAKASEIAALTDAYAVKQWIDSGGVEAGWEFDFVNTEAAIRAALTA